MARLPSTRYVMQQIGDRVVLFQNDTEMEILSFDPTSPDEAARTQKIIYDNTLLSDEDKCFAHFWSGYFYAAASLQ